MLGRLFISMLIVGAIAQSGLGQSLMLRDGQKGPFAQGAYFGGDGISGFELDLGFAASRDVDFGGGVAWTKYKSGGGGQWESGSSHEVTVGGQMLDVYPTRVGSESVQWIPGVHQALVWTSGSEGIDEGLSMTLGASSSLLLRTLEDGALAITAGYQHTGLFGDIDETDVALCSVSIHKDRPDTDPIGLILQLSFDGDDLTAAVGCGYTFLLPRPRR